MKKILTPWGCYAINVVLRLYMTVDFRRLRDHRIAPLLAVYGWGTDFIPTCVLPRLGTACMGSWKQRGYHTQGLKLLRSSVKPRLFYHVIYRVFSEHSGAAGWTNMKEIFLLDSPRNCTSYLVKEYTSGGITSFAGEVIVIGIHITWCVTFCSIFIVHCNKHQIKFSNATECLHPHPIYTGVLLLFSHA